MPPRTGRRCRQNQDEMQGPTQGPSVGESSTLREIERPERAEPSDPEKAYGIKRLKKLGATVFEGSTDPADAENWLNMLEKCFDVMNCPVERKVRLATFLLQKEAEGWWKSILARRSDALALDWQSFRSIFEDKYYPSTYCKAKRDEFLGLKQGSLSVAEYERKYTKLSRYADVIVASESDRCRRFERGLRFEINTPVTTIAKWTNFSQLVETALHVEQSITEEKSAVELSRGTSIASGFRGREQRRFTLGINISSRQDFKNRSGGQASRNVSYGSVFQRQSQRIPSQPTRSIVRSQPGQESVASTRIFKREFGRKKKRNFTRVLRLKKRRRTQAKCIHGRILLEQILIFIGWFLMKKTGYLVFMRIQEVSETSQGIAEDSIFELSLFRTISVAIFWESYFLSFRLSSRCLIDCLSLLKLRYRLPVSLGLTREINWQLHHIKVLSRVDRYRLQDHEDRVCDSGKVGRIVKRENRGEEGSWRGRIVEREGKNHRTGSAVAYYIFFRPP
uniref:Retrotransposon gag domain-containing protein n=1 Tax=Cucumis melo TaxID=3656 RepID=A0A9I9E5N6_CUCME